ncbi:MAG UNVERIFIED_CONTAM: hypothetical protein LVR29_14275 [Microcystis novacekii LVE1205-3]
MKSEEIADGDSGIPSDRAESADDKSGVAASHSGNEDGPGVLFCEAGRVASRGFDMPIDTSFVGVATRAEFGLVVVFREAGSASKPKVGTENGMDQGTSTRPCRNTKPQAIRCHRGWYNGVQAINAQTKLPVKLNTKVARSKR